MLYTYQFNYALIRKYNKKIMEDIDIGKFGT